MLNFLFPSLILAHVLYVLFSLYSFKYYRKIFPVFFFVGWDQNPDHSLRCILLISIQMFLCSSLLLCWPSRLEILFWCSHDVLWRELFVTYNFFLEHGSVWRSQQSWHINKISRLYQNSRRWNTQKDIKTKSWCIIDFSAAKLQTSWIEYRIILWSILYYL